LPLLCVVAKFLLGDQELVPTELGRCVEGVKTSSIGDWLRGFHDQPPRTRGSQPSPGGVADDEARRVLVDDPRGREVGVLPALVS